MLSAMTAARKSCAREKDARCAFRKEWRAEKIMIDNVVRTVKAGWAQERRRCTDKGEGRFEVGTFSLAEGQTSPVRNHYTVSSTAKNSFVGVKNFQKNLTLAIFSRQQLWLLLLASIALGFPAVHEKMRETRTPYSKTKIKTKRKETK